MGIDGVRLAGTNSFLSCQLLLWLLGNLLRLMRQLLLLFLLWLRMLLQQLLFRSWLHRGRCNLKFLHKCLNKAYK
jgi:hypothetical protein